MEEAAERHRRAAAEVFSERNWSSSCWLRETLEPQTEVKRSLFLRHLHLVSRGKKKRGMKTQRDSILLSTSTTTAAGGGGGGVKIERGEEGVQKWAPLFPTEGKHVVTGSSWHFQLETLFKRFNLTAFVHIHFSVFDGLLFLIMTQICQKTHIERFMAKMFLLSFCKTKKISHDSFWSWGLFIQSNVTCGD